MDSSSIVNSSSILKIIRFRIWFCDNQNNIYCYLESLISLTDNFNNGVHFLPFGVGVVDGQFICQGDGILFFYENYPETRSTILDSLKPLGLLIGQSFFDKQYIFIKG